MAKGKETAKKLALALAVPVLLFALVELGLRLSPLDQELGPERFHGGLEDHSEFWDPDNPLAVPADEERLASEFRHKKVSVKKPPNTFRIITLGGSFTFGWPYGKPEEADQVFSGLLEKRLNEGRAAGARHFEVINAGIGGYTSFQGLAYLKERLLRYKPDLLLVTFGANDSCRNDAIGVFLTDKEYYEKRAAQMKDPTRKALGDLLNQSRVLALLNKVVFAIKQQTAEPTPRVPPDDFYENMTEMVRLGRAWDFKVVLLYEPHDQLEPLEKELEINPHTAVVKQVADENPDRVLLLDTINFFRGHYDRKKELFYDYMHLTKPGHALLADYLNEKLRASGLLPE